MSLVLRPGHRIFVFSEYIDLRAGFDRLSMLVREKVAINLLEGDLFVFLGNSRKKCKAIYYDGSGVVLMNKRLEHGHFMRLSDIESSEITAEEFQAVIQANHGQMPALGSPVTTQTTLTYQSMEIIGDKATVRYDDGAAT